MPLDDSYRCKFQGRCTDPACSDVHQCARFIQHEILHAGQPHQRYGLFDLPPEGWMNRSVKDNALTPLDHDKAH